MPDYINPTPPPNDPDAISDATFDYIRAAFPQYVPHEAQLGSIVITALALRASEVADLVPLIPKAIFRWYGRNVIGLPPLDGTPAQASIALFLRDTAGYTIPEGTLFNLTDADGDDHMFALPAAVVVPAGTASVANVVIVADEDGTQANGITASTVTIVDALDYIINVTQQGSSAGGVDEEEDDPYLDRLTRRLGLIPRPVLAEDFSALLQVTYPEVWRCAYLDNFIPPATTGAEKAVALAPIDALGTALAPTKGTTYATFLAAQREFGFIVNILSPTYTTVDVTFGFTVSRGYVGTEVKPRAEQQVRDYLAPATFGTPSGDRRGWDLLKTIYHWELIAVLNSVLGLDRLVSLTIGANGGAQTATDLTLTGAIPLPQPGAIVGTPQ